MSKDDKICVQSEELCIKNKELCITNEECCILKKMMSFAAGLDFLIHAQTHSSGTQWIGLLAAAWAGNRNRSCRVERTPAGKRAPSSRDCGLNFKNTSQCTTLMQTSRLYLTLAIVTRTLNTITKFINFDILKTYINFDTKFIDFKCKSHLNTADLSPSPGYGAQ